ncbi:transposable element Tcb2 transposase [Trichonephila clavipes]|nr:transposable element Tcb2 transposase [Trichonephila clavipes]
MINALHNVIELLWNHSWRPKEYPEPKTGRSRSTITNDYYYLSVTTTCNEKVAAILENMLRCFWYLRNIVFIKYLMSQLLHQPLSRRKVAPSVGAPVSSRTLRRRLVEKHLGSRHPLRVLPLTPTHRRLRLEWCRAKGNWTATESNQVVFSEESRFLSQQ